MVHVILALGGNCRVKKSFQFSFGLTVVKAALHPFLKVGYLEVSSKLRINFIS
jgi:hypothetical protein